MAFPHCGLAYRPVGNCQFFKAAVSFRLINAWLETSGIHAVAQRTHSGGASDDNDDDTVECKDNLL